MKFIDRKKFVIAALDADNETFVVYVTALNIKNRNMAVHSSTAAQIELLKANKSLTTIPLEYFDYTDIFLPEFTAKLPEHSGINNHIIELDDGNPLLYCVIYSLELVELEMWKAYIKTNLAKAFIRTFKSPVGVPIFFDCKSNGSLCLYVNYCNINNLIIKKQYPFFLISKSLDCLGWAKRFT